MTIKRVLLTIFVLLNFLSVGVSHVLFVTEPVFEIDGNIGVGYRDRNTNNAFVFDRSGNFLKEYSFRRNNDREPGALLGLTPEGSFLFSDFEWNEDHLIVATEFALYDRSGKLVRIRKLDGEWEGQPAANNQVLVKDKSLLSSLGEFNIENFQSFKLDLLDLNTGERKNFLRIDLDAVRYITHWYVSSSNQLFILSSSDEESDLTCHSLSGELLWRLDLTKAIPFGAVEANIISNGNVYVYASMGSLSDEFSLIKITNGKHAERMGRDDLRWTDGALVLENGDLAILANTKIFIVSHAGITKDEWSVLPPSLGDTWKIKRQREIKAAKVFLTSTNEDLLQALLYGKEDQKSVVEEWIDEKGQEILPEILQFYSLHHDLKLFGLLEDLQIRYPEKFNELAILQFEKSDRNGKKVLLPFVTRKTDNLPSINIFLEELSQGDAEEQAISREYLVKSGKGNAILHDAVLKALNSGSEIELAEIQDLLFADPLSGISELGSQLHTAPEVLRPMVRKLLFGLVESLQWVEEKSVTNEVRKQLLSWTTSKEAYLQDTGAVLLFELGDAEFAQAAVKVAASDFTCLPYVVNRFEDMENVLNLQIDSASVGLLPVVLLYLEESKEEEFISFRILGDLAGIRLSSLRNEFLRSIFSEAIQPRMRTAIFQAAIPYLESAEFESHQIGTVLKTFLTKPARNNYIWEFIQLVAKEYHQPEIQEILREILKVQASQIDSKQYARFLEVFEEVVREEDVPFILPFLDMTNVGCGSAVVIAGLNVLDELDSIPEISNRLLSWLEHADLRFPTARLLSKEGRPEALPVLLDALKNEHEFRLRARHFQTYGQRAVELLLPMIVADQRKEARDRAILILSELRSDAAFTIIKEKFEQNLFSGDSVDPALLAAMMYYGQNPWPKVLMYLDSKNCSSWSKAFNEYFPSELVTSSVELLGKKLIAETDTDKAEGICCALNWNSFNAKGRPILTRIKMEHSVAEIRELIPESRMYRYSSYSQED